MSENWNVNGEEEPVAGNEAGDLGEGPADGARKSLVSRSTLLLLLVFVLGLGMIWLLGAQAHPRKATAAEEAVDSQVDSAIAEMVGKSARREEVAQLFKQTDNLVQMFYNYPGAASVPADELPINPFEHQGARPAGATTGPVGAVAVTVTDLAEQTRLRKAAESFATLKLQSIMVSGSTSAAMINNQLVQKGAKVGEFTVDQIEPQRVILSLGGNRFELKLEQK